MTEFVAEKSNLCTKIAERLGELTLRRVAKEAVDNAQLNHPFIGEGKSIRSLQDTELMDGDSALVIAAGPSLHRFDTARLIKESGFKGILVATESSMAWCLRNGIVPHLTVTLDPHPKRIVRWFGDPDLSKTDLDVDDYFARQDFDPIFREKEIEFNRELLSLVDGHGPQMKIAVASCASHTVIRRVMESKMDAYWWNPMYDDTDIGDGLTRRLYELNRLPCLNAGGNVGTACWVFAHAVLKKKKIGILGMDLGYYDDTTYRETQKYYELIDLVGEDRLDEVFIHIHNPYVNRTFFSEPTFVWYRDAFLQMAEWANEDGVQTYNCTGGGILFGDSIKFTSFEDFLAATRC